MKLLISSLLMVGLSTAAIAQDVAKNDVPSAVLNTFNTNFSNAVDIEWEMEGDLYKGEFEIGKAEHEVWIDKSGNINRHKSDISKEELPERVREKIKSDYKDYSIDDVEKIEIDGTVYYEIELDGKSRDLDIILSPDGTVQQGIK